MKTNEFNTAYSIDRSATTPRAISKCDPVEYSLALTADKKPFNHAAEYFFFDGERVRSSQGLRRVDAENLGSTGLRVIAINKLRQSRDAVLVDAQVELIKRIDVLREKVREFEEEKTLDARTMKYILRSRG